jgi:hypothetical protein
MRTVDADMVLVAEHRDGKVCHDRGDRRCRHPRPAFAALAGRVSGDDGAGKDDVRTGFASG